MELVRVGVTAGSVGGVEFEAAARQAERIKMKKQSAIAQKRAGIFFEKNFLGKVLGDSVLSMRNILSKKKSKP